MGKRRGSTSQTQGPSQSQNLQQKRCNRPGCSSLVEGSNGVLHEPCPMCKQQRAYCSRQCKESDASHARCLLRHLQSLASRRQRSLPQGDVCHLVHLLRCPGDAPLAEVLQAVAQLLPVQLGAAAYHWSKRQAQAMVDAGLVEAIAGFAGHLLQQLSQAEQHACPSPLTATVLSSSSAARLSNIILTLLELSNLLQDAQVGEALVLSGAAAPAVAALSSGRSSQMLCATILVLSTFGSAITQDADLQYFWGQAAKAVTVGGFKSLLKLLHQPAGMPVAMALLRGMMGESRSPRTAQVPAAVGLACACLLLRSAEFRQLLMAGLHHGPVPGKEQPQLLWEAIDALCTAVDTVTSMQPSTAGGGSASTSSNASTSRNASAPTSTSTTSASPSSPSSPGEVALAYFLGGGMAEALLGFLHWGIEHQGYALSWCSAVMLLGAPVEAGLACSTVVQQAVAAPGQQHVARLLQLAFDLAAQQLGRQAALLLRLLAACFDAGPADAVEVRQLTWQQLAAAAPDIRQRLLWLLQRCIEFAEAALAGAAAAGTAGAAAAHGAAARTVAVVYGQPSTLGAPMLVLLLISKLEPSALSLAELQASGLAGLMEKLPVNLLPGEHAGWLLAVISMLQRELAGGSAAEALDLGQQELAKGLQVLLEVLNQGSAASLPSGQHLVWLERLLTLGELLLEEAQPSEELRHELLSAITAIVLRAVELPTADVAELGPEFFDILLQALDIMANQMTGDPDVICAGMELVQSLQLPATGPSAPTAAQSVAPAPAAAGPAAAQSCGLTAAGASSAPSSDCLAAATGAGLAAASRAAGPMPRPARAVPPRYRRLPRPKTCSACGAGLSAAVPRFRVCYGCHCARYCGPQCQAAHWARHRQSCEAWGDVLRGMAGLGLGE